MKCMRDLILRLGVILAVQLALVTLLWWPKGSQTAVAKKLFAGMPFSEIQEVHFAETGGKEMALRKKEGHWVVPDQFEYPADENKVAEFFGKLEGLPAGQAVGKTKAGHARFEVSDEKFQRKVTLGEDGFYLGSAPRFRSVHIRRFHQDEVYATDQLSAYEIAADPKSWLERKLLPTRSEEVEAIEIQRGKETLKFERVEKPAAEGETPAKVWLIDGKPVAQSAFDAILRNVSDLRLTEVLGREERPDFGLKNPQAVLKITYRVNDKQEERTFAVGKKSENDVIVRPLNSPFYVKVALYQLSPILEAKKKDLIDKSG